ncbi:ion channel [Tsuneonella sp. HG249]
MTLLHQILLAASIVAAIVVLDLIGLAILLAILRRHRPASTKVLAIVLDGAAILFAAFGLFALHSLEIWLWAGIYYWLDLFAQFEPSLYFSTSTYVTIGYGDVVLPEGSRILGSIEGASGIILIGWSTAFFFLIVDRLKLLERGLERELDR